MEIKQKYKISKIDEFGNNTTIEFDTEQEALNYLETHNIESDIEIFEEDCTNHLAKLFKLSNSVFTSQTIDVDYNIKCIKKPPIIDDDGFRVQQDYHFFTNDEFGNYIFGDLVVRENFNFILDVNNDVDIRILQILATNEDNELILIKECPKFYDEITKMIERQERRQNLINKSLAYLKDNLISSEYDSLLSSASVNIGRYIQGITEQLLNYFRNHITLSQEIKDAILIILDR